MSNRKRINPPPSQDPVSAAISALDGLRIPGGCDHCNAEQALDANVHGHGGIHMLRVLHDEDCPWLAARKAQR